MRVFKELEKLTYDLERRPDYNPLAVYRTVDRQNEGKIDKINLDAFFKRNSLFLTEREQFAIIRRIDTSADQCITFNELKAFFEDQVGFRSEATVLSLNKATPQVREYMHEEQQKE